MSTLKIDLYFPLDFGRADFSNYVKLEMNLPTSATRVVPLREAPGIPLPARNHTGRERFVNFDGKAHVVLTVSNGVGHGRHLHLDLRFQIVVADPTDLHGRNTKTPLLWGEVTLDAAQVFISSFPEFDHLIRCCWLTGDLREIRKLKFEPSGFYLVGQMPRALLGGEARQWVLRVPQPRLTVDSNTGLPVAAPPRRVRNDQRWELTAERFGDVPNAVSSVEFSGAVNEAFRSFSAHNRKILDSIADRSDSRMSIDFVSVDRNRIRWSTLGAGTRIVIGGLEAGETQFLPNTLTGEIHRNDSRAAWHHHHTRYVDAETIDAAQQMSLRRPVTLKLTQSVSEEESQASVQPDLDFPDVDVVGLSVPTVRTQAASTDRRRETVERAWMCVEQGWLGLDADVAEPELKPDAAPPGRMGVISISRLMKSIGLSSDQGFDLRLIPRRGRFATVSLEGDDRATMRLTVDDPLVVLTTPPIWYQDVPQQRPDPDDADAPVAARPRDWAPSLAHRLELSESPPPESPPASSASPPKRGGVADRNQALRQVFRPGDWIASEAVERRRRLFPLLKLSASDIPGSGRIPSKIRDVFAAERHPLSPAAIIRELETDQRWQIDDQDHRYELAFDQRLYAYDLTPTHFEASVRWDNDDGFLLSLPTTKERAVFWNSPRAVPIVRTYPQATSQVPTALLEDQRGMLPLELKRERISLRIVIPARTLPRLLTDPGEFSIAASPDWANVVSPQVHWMLPTLPGVEAQVDGDAVSWRMRHSVPVLDESYRETREAKDVLRTPNATDIDITRVEEAVAFPIQLGPQIATYLPPTDLSHNRIMVASFSPRGRSPKLVLKLAHGREVVFERKDNLAGGESVAGLTSNIDVSVQHTSGRLPSFQVAFTDDDSPWEIRRTGQPLVVTRSDEFGLVSFDGKATVRHEPIEGLTRCRRAGDVDDLVKRTQSCSGAALALEFVGLQDGTLDSALDIRAQFWTFHDGQGDWPRLFGFPIYPLAYEALTGESVTVSGALLPAAQIQQLTAAADDPGPGRHVARAVLATPVTAAAVFQCRFPGGGPLELQALTGGFQWRFDRPADSPAPPDNSVHVVGVAAKLKSLETDYATLIVTELVLDTPMGAMQLRNLSAPAKLADSKLAISPITHELKSVESQIGAKIELGTIEIASDNKSPTEVTEFALQWAENRGKNVEWKLLFQNDSAWTFTLSIQGTGLRLVYQLTESRRDSNTLVFSAEAGAPEESGTFFQITKSSGVVSAVFSTPTHLQFFNGELVLGLQSRNDEQDLLAGRLRLSGSVLDPLLETTGSFGLPNAIRLTTADGDLQHQATVFLDRARLPLLPILHGEMTDEPQQVAAVVRHELSFSAGKSVTWQAAQWLRLRSWKNFKQTYFVDDAKDDTALSDTTLVLDAGTVTWLQKPLEELKTTPPRVPDVQNSTYGVGFAVRKSEAVRTDASGCFIRLPFATVGDSTVLHELAIDLQGEGIELRAPGAQRLPLRFATPTPRAELSFFERSPAAERVQSQILADELRPLNGASSLPLYEHEKGFSVRFPAVLPDLAPLASLEGKRTLIAATPVRRYPVTDTASTAGGSLLDWWRLYGQVLFGSSLLDIGVTVEFAAPLSSNQRSPVQLLVVRSDGFIRVANDELSDEEEVSDAAVLEWAQGILKSKPPSQIALVLRDHARFVVVPARVEVIRQEVGDSWAYEPRDPPIAPDPRLVVPHQIVCDSEPSVVDKKHVRFQADPEATLFAYQADVPATESGDRPVTATTHFRIASIHGGRAFQGMLRPARAASGDDRRWAAWSYADEVDFEATASGTYPAIDTATLANQMLPSLTVEPDSDGASTTDTLMPPLLHCLSWASRPGEMATTVWTLDSFAAEDELVTLKRGTPTVATVRRPRAQAGRFESVRLINPADRSPSGLPRAGSFVFQRRFLYAEFDLEQTLGRTPAPDPFEMNAVFLTKETYFESRKTKAAATLEPALLYEQPTAPKRPCHLSLFADPRYNPNEAPGFPEPIKTQSYLLLAQDAVDPPDSYADGESPELPDGMRNLLDGAIPELADDAWDRLENETQAIYRLEVEGRRLEEYASALAVKKLYFFAYRYQLNVDDRRYHLRASPEMVIEVQVLEQSAALTAPKMSVMLLHNTSSEHSRVLGYGRLSPGDFSPPEPHVAVEQDANGTPKSFLQWVRYSRLRSLDRTQESDGDVPNRQYDVVVYGSGGELVPTRSLLPPLS